MPCAIADICVFYQYSNDFMHTHARTHAHAHTHILFTSDDDTFFVIPFAVKMKSLCSHHECLSNLISLFAKRI